MQTARIVCVVLFMGYAAWGGGSDAGAASTNSVPPVLRNHDPAPNVIVRLPGPAQVSPVHLAPAADAKAVEPVAPSAASDSDDPPRPLLRHIYPPSFEEDSAAFCQQLIGQWTESDARFLLGEPLRQRPAYNDDGVRNGVIYAFSDPTHRYQELELDFNGVNGSLRTVFVYPFHLTWQEARQKWGDQASATDANQGRRFYSYDNRRLDVLVDRAGKVISFGLY